jgi:predicted phage terminase large subunit-like protein
MSDRARLLRAVRRQHLVAFNEKVFYTLQPGGRYEHNWHLDHISWQLTRIAHGEVRRLIVTVPPRSMKSMTVSIGFTAWLLGHDPTKRIICVSYADDLARTLSGDTRAVMESPWYQEMFPRTRLASKRPRNIELVTTRRGYRYAAGMNGSVLGRGADLIVVDDPIKATDALSQAERRRVNETFDNTILTRLNDKRTGMIVLIMQRLHEDDLVGHVTASGDWEVVSIPAIATDRTAYRLSDDPNDVYVRQPGEVLYAREPREILETIRRAQGSLTFSAQYQQSPVPPEGNIVKREWLRYYTEAPSEFDVVVASWDTASTLSESADFSVGTVWGAKALDFYLLDVVRGRFEVPELRRQVVRLADKWGADQTIIEDAGIGRAVAQDLRRSGETSVVLRPVRFDKEARFLAQSARFESGQVHVPEAPWLADWLNELLAFPNGRHDDQVDSTSQALDWLSQRTRPLHVARQPRERPNPGPRPSGFPRPPGFIRRR